MTVMNFDEWARYGQGTAGGCSATRRHGARNTDPESSHRAVQTCAGLGYDEHALCGSSTPTGRRSSACLFRGRAAGHRDLGRRGRWARAWKRCSGLPSTRPDRRAVDADGNLVSVQGQFGDLVDSFTITAPQGRPWSSWGHLKPIVMV